MVASVAELELGCIDHMDRDAVLGAIRAHAEYLPGDLLARLEEQSDDCLRLLLLAGRVIRLLRHLRDRP